MPDGESALEVQARGRQRRNALPVWLDGQITFQLQ
jgi:hypothetical protein